MRTSSTTSWVTPAFMASVLMLPWLPVHASVEDPKLLPTPPMGFNNWARFECDLNETLFTDTAQAMVKTGLLDAGYNRLNLDDCWMLHNRAANGSLQWDTTKFPHGIPWLADYAHAHGFHLGIYEDSGNATCGGYPGSYGYEQQDADTFASWGIDYLKLDGCNVYAEDGRSLRDEYKVRYGQWHQILSAMAQPLIFSESAPAYFSDNKTEWAMVMDWIPYYGELARHSDDVLVYVGEGSAWDSIMVNYNFNTLVVRYQQPGYYNDPDFLIPDHPGLTDAEKRSHFALWASFGAPLILSAYIPSLSSDDIKFLSNKDLIAVDQDSLAQQAALVSRDSNFDVLTRSLANGDRLLTVLNRGSSTEKITIPVAHLGLDPKCKYRSRELVDGSTSTISGSVEIKLDSHATTVYRITPPRGCTGITPTGMILSTVSGNCLTASSTRATFGACNAADTQVWHVAGQGSKVTISPLSEDTKCLAVNDKGDLSLLPCKGGSGTNWSHFITGHVQNARGGCLTESDGQAALVACELSQGGQILGLPSGVHIVEGSGKK
ncbi:hypothetical protein N7462_004912 [Penicillium macrosclerotiorum]|uniref:uncharacterized protein n=1 Tax=Penicillium macrosclerotiorum TaxID=303699 RepID=UPI00254839B3|nr:uncharacterized protein N7462_004912 [Penicillium macrosclerotiorum]KAJ5690520.1 hypothetical protein N7462_004912 [Penicillium macrosclerotiorum]